ncbi:MAG: PQQ-binding-like beta-propeller repeat protein [Pseudomonadota bacterium]
MIRRIVLLVLTVGALFAGYRIWQESRVGAGVVDVAVAPEEPAREIAFVANAVGGTISLVDLDARRVIGELDIVPDGRRVSVFRDFTQGLIGQRLIERGGGLNYAQDTDLSPDGRTLYVARGHIGDVAAFDLASGRLRWRTRVAGVRADHMAIAPDGSRLYVSGTISDVMDVIDARTGERLARLPTGVWPHDVHATPDNHRIFNASLGDMQEEDEAARGAAEEGDDPWPYQLTVYDAATLEQVERYRFPRGIRPFQLSADETTIFAQLSNEHSIVAYHLFRREIVDRIDLPVAEGVSEEDWDFEAPHHGLVLTPDGETLCAAGRASDYAALVAADGLELLATVPVGNAPSWSAVSADGALCLVANNRSDDVSLVDIAARTEVARLDVGRAPKHITVGRVPESILRAIAR